MHKKVIRRVIEQIENHPETHNQDYYENICGTTRCVAGWGVHFSPKFEVEHTMPRRVEDGRSIHWYAAGREALGLKDSQADYLFYDTDEKEALAILKFLIGYQPDLTDED